MKRDLTYIPAALLTLGVFSGLLVSPAEASSAARDYLALCASTIIPSLFPFMVISSMILKLGLAGKLGNAVKSLSAGLFGVSGAGASAFLLGAAGGYPLGAYAVSELYAGSTITKDEAGRLLRFCDNCGPAFIVSVAGTAVFKSAAVGYFLLGVHLLSALAVGVIFRGKVHGRPAASDTVSVSFSTAFTESVKRAALSCLSVCGFVTFFGVLTGLLDAWNILPALCARISLMTGAGLHFTGSLARGILEIGGGITSMSGLSLNAASLALCSFILGWGGLSVQAQAAQAIRESGLSPAPHLIGKLLHGGLSALITYIAYPLFF